MIFWKVKRRKKGKEFKPSEIWGNQVWKGADPNLIIIDIKIIEINILVEKRKNKNDEKRNIDDENDWII